MHIALVENVSYEDGLTNFLDGSIGTFPFSIFLSIEDDLVDVFVLF